MPFRRTDALFIAIPYYNNPDLLAGTLAHLGRLQRDGWDFHVYISDDASPEPARLESWKDLSNVVYERHESNAGLVGNYNRCVAKIRAAAPCWSLILDSDDVPFADAFRDVRGLGENETVGIVIGGYEIVNVERPEVVVKRRRFAAASRVLGSREAYRWLFPKNRTASSGVWVHSDVYAEIGDYALATKYCCDWDLYVRATSVGGVAISDKVFCRILHHQKNNTWTFMKSGESFENEVAALKRNWPLAARAGVGAIDRYCLAAEAAIHHLCRMIRN